MRNLLYDVLVFPTNGSMPSALPIVANVPLMSEVSKLCKISSAIFN